MPDKKRTDWRKRFAGAHAPRVVVLDAPFAGVPAGARMLISSPGEIAAYVARIPHGQSRTIARLRSDLARQAKAAAMCPVTTAIYLRVVAEVALADLAAGKTLGDVIPFWRVIEPESKIAARLSCGAAGVAHLRQLDLATTL